ncbi:cytochrome b [Pseudomaricurvus sp.]|uniref:cytochrome b n=1 Tax=Pseudomaricurvus sp. TaxID=2004510 RepID=UPI003F6CFB76
MQQPLKMIKNTPQTYGSVSKCLHWAIALVIVGMFILGLWMVDLTYYDSWYVKAPHYHKSVGILIAFAMIFRLLWRWSNPTPKHIVSHKPWEVSLALATHVLLYILIFSILVTGYLIPTADGRGIDVFNWFTVPSVGSFFDNQEDVAGDIHYWSAWAVIALASLHTIAAIKHHVLDKDATLKRML